MISELFLDIITGIGGAMAIISVFSSAYTFFTNRKK